MPETEVEQPQQAPMATPDEKAPTKEKEEVLQEESAEKKDAEKKDQESTKGKEKASKAKSKKDKEEKAPQPPPPPPVHMKSFEKDTVYLFQFPRCPTVPSISPACLKVETWLKLHGIKYENVNHQGKLRSKRGLLPFVELNGEEIADSDHILADLAKKYEKEIDGSLTGEQKNIQHAMLSMVDNHFHGAFWYWAFRNADDIIKGYKLNLQQYTGTKVPNGILNFWFKFQHSRKGFKKAKAVVGSGHTDEEVELGGKKDLQVLREMLGDKQFFFGDEPHSLDLSLFCQLAQIINLEGGVKCPLKEYLESECTNLVGLYNRMKDRAWGDHWDESIGEKLDLNPHIPKPDPPKEEEKEAKDKKEDADNKKEEGKEKGDKDEKEKEDKKEEEEEKKE